MPTIKKRVLDLLEDLRVSIDLESNPDNMTSDEIETTNIINEIEDLIQDNLLVSKDVFND
tara:strand:+ start:106 stop:285 length:180 start_codon:yes stop_codon:yes gene_type:complete